MATDVRDRVADSFLALIPLYHKHIFKTGPPGSGLRIAQYRVLGLLMKTGSLSMSEIGRHLYISKPYMTALSDTLLENKWIERHNDPNDRRIIRLSITPRGKKHLKQAFEIYRSDVKTLISGLDDLDLQKLSASLEELQRIFAKMR